MQQKDFGTNHNFIESIVSSSCPDENNLALDARKFMDEMPGGFFIYRAGGEEEILYANKALLRMFNCGTMEEFQALTGNSFRGLVYPEDLEPVETSIREQISRSQYDLDYVEYRIVQKGGEIRWVEDHGHFVHNDSLGDIFYVFATDATDKKQFHSEERNALLNEKLLKEKILQSQIDEYDKELEDIHQEHLRRLEVIEGLSLNYESILYANLNTDRILPYRLSKRTQNQFENLLEFRSFTWFASNYVQTWVCPEDQDAVRQALDPAYIRKTLSSHRTFYVNYRVQTGEETLYLQFRIARVGQEEPISRIVLGARRVDEEIRHEMEQKKFFEAALNQAKLANVSKNTFLSNMSHDMRTPLNAITGFTALAKNHRNDPETLSNYLNSIQEASSHLLHLVNNILEISRMESGAVQTEDTDFCLTDLLQEIQKTMLAKAENKNLSLSLDLLGLKHPDICADENKLRQVLLYLADNAVKYTPEGGHIRITAAEQKDPADDHAFYQFSVEDDGIGIGPQHLERIFEPFERIRNTTQSGIHGTGLGLTLARQMTEIMGGTIEVKSTPGKGSRFTVSFHFHIQNTSSPLPERLEEVLPAFLKEQKILLVDDNEINLEIESDLLEETGFSVELATDGSIAVEKVKTSAPGTFALILMDIQMPIMNGYEATLCIRGLDSPSLAGIPIIALSANAFEEDLRMSLESGMNAHLSKPFDMDKLLQIMAHILLPKDSPG